MTQNAVMRITSSFLYNTSRMESKLVSIIEEAIEKKVFPGCVLGYLSRGEMNVLPFGKLTYEENAVKVHENTIYDVASLTKAIPTSSLALYFLDQKKLALNDLLSQYLPEYKGEYRDTITIWHLLTHSVAFDLRLSLLKQYSSDEIFHQLLTLKVLSKPGTTFSYSNASSILLSVILERVGGKSIDLLAEDIFFQPLDMTHTSFHPTQFGRDDIAPSEIDSWREREVRGEVHDESAFILREKMVVGSAGLFSTAGDLLQFMKMLLSGGKTDYKTFFSQEILEMMTTDQLSKLRDTTGLGWELSQRWYMGKNSTERTFGKTGFTGCHIAADIGLQKAVVLLSNSTYPNRPRDKEGINKVRRAVTESVFSL